MASQAAVRVEIVRFTDDYPPGLVEYRLRDADGREWLREIKHIYVTEQELWWDSVFPLPGLLECEVLELLGGRARIVTEDGIECIVLESSLVWPTSAGPT